MRRHSIIGATLLFVLLVLAGPSCTTVGSATLGGTVQKQSHQMAQELEQSGALVDSAELEAYVRAVGQRLVEQAESPPVPEFYFGVLDDPAPNAFSIPSGHVYISRGLLTLLSNEDELAGVLGHEIGHVLKQHSLKRVTGQVAYAPVRIVTQIGGGLVGLFLPRVGNVVKGTGELPAALAGASYGRSQEDEADRVGQQLAAKAGWDPMALARVMDALARETERAGQDSTRVSWFATHPASPDRAASLRASAEALSVGPSHPVASSRRAFLAGLEGLMVGPSPRGGVFQHSRFLHPGLGFVLEFPPGEGWQQVNTEQAVAVVRENPRAAVILEVVGKGDDALEVARAFEPESGKLDGPPTAERVNGLSTAYATGGDPVRWGRQEGVRASARWIAYGGLVYRLLCESTESGYEVLAEDFDAAGRSFRALTPKESSGIMVDELHIETAREGETLAVVLDRSNSDWDLEAAASANGVEPNATFEGGDPVKVTRQEPFASHL